MDEKSTSPFRIASEQYNQAVEAAPGFWVIATRQAVKGVKQI